MKQPVATTPNIKEMELTLQLAHLNQAELAEVERQCRLRASAYLRNAEIVAAWMKGRSDDMAN